MTYGQIAYEAYGESRGWKTYGGTPMPPYDQQNPEIREAWEEAAKAVAIAVTAGPGAPKPPPGPYRPNPSVGKP